MRGAGASSLALRAWLSAAILAAGLVSGAALAAPGGPAPAPPPAASSPGSPSPAPAESPSPPALDEGLRAPGEALPDQAPQDDRPALPLSLRGAVRLALARNLRIEAASFGPPAADGRILNEKGIFDPIFTWRVDQRGFGGGPGSSTGHGTEVGAGLSHMTGDGARYGIHYQKHGDVIDLTTGAPRIGGLTDTIFDLAVPMLRGSGADIVQAPLQIAIQGREAAVARFSREALDLAAQVTRGVWGLEMAREILRVRREAAERSRRLLGLVEEGVVEGSKAEYETYESRQSVLTQEASVQAAERDVALAEQSLCRLLNLPQGRQRLVPEETDLEFAPPPPEEAAILEAQGRRPEVREAEVALEVARLRERLLDNGTLPAMDVVGEYRLGSASDRLYDWRLGVQFEVPLGNRGALGSLEEARAGVQQARALFEDVQQGVALEVAQALSSVEANTVRLKVAEEAQVWASRRVEAELERFSAGFSPAHQVIYAEQQLLINQELEALARLQARTARLDLARALGVLLEELDITIVADPGAPARTEDPGGS